MPVVPYHRSSGGRTREDLRVGVAPFAFLAFSVVVAIYLWRSAPSARQADERRRWWAFTDRGDPEPFFGPRPDADPAAGETFDDPDRDPYGGGGYP